MSPISGFTAGNDLINVSTLVPSLTKLNFVPNSTHNGTHEGGVLTVADGFLTATLNFADQPFEQNSFQFGATPSGVGVYI